VWMLTGDKGITAK
jgi:magnesium-transporting ATPase (P-type)